MLTHLTIKNYVLIESLDIDLEAGFSVITGETGAGKSIILGALGLLMGTRADARSIMPGARKCVVEGTFDISGFDLQNILQDNELDIDPTDCTLRREVADSGKSRAFIGDTPVRIDTLKEVAYRLLDIHSQHSNLLLEHPSFQLEIVDTIAGHTEQLSLYREGYAHLQETLCQLREAEQDLEKRQSDEDYLRFQLDQLETLQLQPGEDEYLRGQQRTLSHAQDIKAGLTDIYAQLTGESDNTPGAVLPMRHALQTMQQLARIYPEIDEYLQRLESAIIEVGDIADDIGRSTDDIEYNPARLQEVTERLDRLYALEQKHHVDSAERLIDIAQNIRSQIESMTQAQSDITALRQQADVQTQQIAALACQLTAARTKAATILEGQIAKALAILEMPAAQFRVSIETHPETLTPDGQDIVCFHFAASPGLPTRPLAEVASGGEMSRVMLALKALTSKQRHLPTIIFDEIDAGVSGKQADAMAQTMTQMSNQPGRQVIAITHLPQIAAKAQVHYHVYKSQNNGQTRTHIRKLTNEERIQELAHMLSGSKVTAAAIENARQLLVSETVH